MRNTAITVMAGGLVALTGCVRAVVTPPATPSVTTSRTPTAGGTSPNPPLSGQPVTLVGVIRAGALPGCNTLVAEDGMHYLLLDTTDPPRNLPVAVTGVPDTSLVSYFTSRYTCGA
jgi:hypothetical protein